MAKTKSSVRANNIKNIRVCDLTIVPLNQLEQMAKEGYQIPMIKQGIYSDSPYLTSREKECLSQFVDGFNVKSIASNFGISERAIALLLQSLREKFEVDTQTWNCR